MSDGEPRVQVETCLAELHEELAGLGVNTLAMRDQEDRACLEVYDRYGRSRRVYVYTQFFWFIWGEDPDERHSLFRPTETADRLARLALGPGWPPQVGDLTKILNKFLR